jgi:hypothetical protein
LETDEELPQDRVPEVPQLEVRSGDKALSRGVTPNDDRVEATEEPARAATIATTASMMARRERKALSSFVLFCLHGYILLYL